VVWREDRELYVLGRFDFDNEVDGIVTGYLMISKQGKKPVPATVALNVHAGSKKNVTVDDKSSEKVGEILVKRGYLVAAIDSYFSGARMGAGPATDLEDRRGEEHSLS